MRILLSFFLACLFTIAVLSVSAAPQADAKFEQLAALVSQKMMEYHVPGVAFGVVKDGQKTVRGFGVTNINNPQPITPDTIYPIASISKTVIATAMMRLAEQGKVDLNAPVRRYLPDFRVQDEAMSRDVAIWNLLTHTSGWRGGLPIVDHGTLSLADFVQSMSDQPKLSAPGEVWAYNNEGFYVAARVIEVVTGKSFTQAISELVFQPAGLTHSYSRLTDVVTHQFSVGHQEFDGKTVANPSFTIGEAVGGLAMSLNDLLTYGKFHLSDAKLEPMRRARFHKTSTDDDMGIGWHLRKIGGVTTVAHGGTLQGQCLILELVPERNLILVILANHSSGSKLVQDAERAALQLYEGVSLDPNHVIANRGIGETMAIPPILAQQPAAAQYIGTYQGIQVIEEKGKLILRTDTSVPSGWRGDRPVAFYGLDRVVVTDGSYRGDRFEFIRQPDGTVGWIDGLILRRKKD